MGHLVKKIILFIITSIILITTGACSDKNKDDFFTKSDFYLDTVVSIQIYNPDEKSESTIDKAFTRIGQLENILSVHVKDSDLYKIKENAGIAPVKVSDETFYLFKKSLEYSELSKGVFDITTGPLVALWAIDPPTGHIPTGEELKETMPLTDYTKVVLDEDSKTIMLKDKNMFANLGAIAKGYIADEVKKVLLDNKVEHGIINLGGNVLLVNNKPSGQDFKVGVQDPFSNRGYYLGFVNAKDVSIVSSGDYERYFEVDGKRYHHILSPFTGFPAENEVSQVTIISKYSVDGDALSTTAFLLGLEDAMDLIESIEGTEAIFITKDKKIVMTSGIKDQFVFDKENYDSIYEIVK